jgi:crotonobetainyl-CoA:carnitine CoA-transferase CaiB-like acyl-CoA transferase
LVSRNSRLILDLPTMLHERRIRRNSRQFSTRFSVRNRWQHWHDVFERARVTYGIVKTAAEVTTDPQALANDIIVPIEGGGEHLTRTVSSPIKIHGVPKAAARRAPELGEHNDEVLRELGFGADQIESFRTSGAIPQVTHDEALVGGKR